MSLLKLVGDATFYHVLERIDDDVAEAKRCERNHRAALGRFLASGLVPIDNGAVERLHIRAAIARKNFLFAGPTPAASGLRSPSRSSAAAASRA